MKKFSALLTTFVFTAIQFFPAWGQNSQAGTKGPTYEPVKIAGGLPAYLIDGKDLFVPGSSYRIIHKDLIKAEGGKYLQVPADYRNPNGKKLSIYYTSAAPFDPSKPTVIFVTGGPGQAIHDLYPTFREHAIKAGVNIILFDPRGIALSSPESPLDYQDLDIWGTKKIAQDMLSIINDLGVDKVTVNGISFGTAPASVFATLYPERTRSVILEGIMGKDMALNQQSERYARLLNARVLPHLNALGKQFLQDMYPALKKNLSESSYLLGSYSADFIAVYINTLIRIYPALRRLNLKISPTEIYSSVETAFSSLIFHDLINQTEDQVTRIIHSEKVITNIAAYALSELLESRKLETQSAQTALLPEPSLQNSDSKEGMKRTFAIPVNGLSQDDTMFRNIGIVNLWDNFYQEISFDVRNGFQSIQQARFPDQSVYSQILQFRTELDESLYDAKNLSIQAPTYYFEGTGDHATEFAGASYHYKNAPEGKAYFFAFKNAGHNPLQNLIEVNPAAGYSLYKQAVLGLAPSTNEIANIRDNLFPLAYTDNAGNGVTTSGVVLKNRCENAFAQ